MDGMLNPISADSLDAPLGTASTPIVLSVRRRNAFGPDDRVIVCAVACDVASHGNGSTVRGKASRLSCIERAAEKRAGRSRCARGWHLLKLFHTRGNAGLTEARSGGAYTTALATHGIG
jgi:hypothetical protein